MLKGGGDVGKVASRRIRCVVISQKKHDMMLTCITSRYFSSDTFPRSMGRSR